MGEHQQEVRSHHWCGSVRIGLWENTNKRYGHITGVAQLELVCGRTPTRGTVQFRQQMSHTAISMHDDSCCLVPRPCAPPGEKQSDEVSPISWTHYQNVVTTNQIVRLLTTCIT